MDELETGSNAGASGDNGVDGNKVGQQVPGDMTAQLTQNPGGQTIPYERFQEVNTKYRDLESKYGQMQQVLDQMKGALSPESKKKGFKLDYSNPDKSIEEYVNNMLEERLTGMKKESSEREMSAQRESAVKWFKDQESYSPELEEKAARFIIENGLQGLDPMKAIQLAHKFVTMGDGSGYTRTVKEGLRKPGTGGKGKEMDAKSELAALDPSDEKYEEKMKALHAKLIGG